MASTLELLEHNIVALHTCINNTSPAVKAVLQIIPTNENTEQGEDIPNTIHGIVQLLVQNKALPNTYNFKIETTAPLKAIHKIILTSHSSLLEIDEQEKRATNTWLRAKHSFNIVMIPIVENTFTKHLHASTVANKQTILEAACRAADSITRKYLIPPNPRDSFPAPRRILNVRTRIPLDAREILEEYWNKHLQPDGKSYVPPTEYPLLEHLTGLPRNTIVISYYKFRGRKARGEKREAKSERRKARGEKRESKSESRKARVEKRESKSESRKARGRKSPLHIFHS